MVVLDNDVIYPSACNMQLPLTCMNYACCDVNVHACFMYMHGFGTFPCMQHAGYMNTNTQLKCDQWAMVWVT